MGDPSNTVRHHREFSWSDQALNSSQMQQTLYYCCTNTLESSVDALSGAPKHPLWSQDKLGALDTRIRLRTENVFGEPVKCPTHINTFEGHN
jgi:hypothetical protein